MLPSGEEADQAAAGVKIRGHTPKARIRGAPTRMERALAARP